MQERNYHRARTAVLLCVLMLLPAHGALDARVFGPKAELFVFLVMTDDLKRTMSIEEMRNAAIPHHPVTLSPGENYVRLPREFYETLNGYIEAPGGDGGDPEFRVLLVFHKWPRNAERLRLSRDGTRLAAKTWEASVANKNEWRVDDDVISFQPQRGVHWTFTPSPDTTFKFTPVWPRGQS